MSDSVELGTLPSLFFLYRRIFFGHKPGWNGQSLPQIQVRCNKVKITKSNVEQYARICNFAFDGKHLPISYLHVPAFRLQAYIFIHPGITFPLLGIIHLKNTINCYQALKFTDEYQLECHVEHSELTSHGVEFVFVSNAYVSGKLVWQSISTYLYRIETGGKRVRPPRAKALTWDNPVYWHLSEDLGRRYAKASGDYNLIHLHPLLSKRYGFDRVLVHGMWSKARCIAELLPNTPHNPCRIDVQFKLPLFMPADVSFAAVQDDCKEKIQFELRDSRGRRSHLSGCLTQLSNSRSVK